MVCFCCLLSCFQGNVSQLLLLEYSFRGRSSRNGWVSWDSHSHPRHPTTANSCQAWSSHSLTPVRKHIKTVAPLQISVSDRDLALVFGLIISVYVSHTASCFPTSACSLTCCFLFSLLFTQLYISPINQGPIQCTSTRRPPLFFLAGKNFPPPPSTKAGPCLAGRVLNPRKAKGIGARKRESYQSIP